MLVLSGDVTKAQAQQLADKYYGLWPAKKLPARNRPQAQDLPGNVALQVTDPELGNNSLVIGLRVPS